jgi:hypothetical protein
MLMKVGNLETYTSGCQRAGNMPRLFRDIVRVGQSEKQPMLIGIDANWLVGNLVARLLK